MRFLDELADDLDFSNSADKTHWSYISVMDIDHYNELFARKKEAMMRALAEPNPHGGSEQLELSRIFTFLSGIPAHTLRRVADKFSLSTDFGETELVYSLYDYLCERKKRDSNVYSHLIANEYCPLMDDFLVHVRRTGEALKQPPTEEQIRAVLGRRGQVKQH